jgi:hypothetical protein
LLEQKETKIQGERPFDIFRAQGCPGNGVKNDGSLSFAKISRTITNV